MYITSRVGSALGALSLILAIQAGPAGAAEIKVLSAVLMQAALEDLSGAFERSSGQKLVISFATASVLKERIQKGEVGDVTILPLPTMEDIKKQAKIIPDSIVTVGRSTVAVSVRAGAPKPDISSVDSLKRSLLTAQSIVYSDPAGGAASGVLFARVLERLGIAEQMRPKTKLTRVPGPGPAEIVAKGEAEIGISQPMEILNAPGAELVGPLPSELQNSADLVYLAALLASAKEPTAAKAFIHFLTSTDAAIVIKKKGLEPGSR